MNNKSQDKYRIKHTINICVFFFSFFFFKSYIVTKRVRHDQGVFMYD